MVISSNSILEEIHWRLPSYALDLEQNILRQPCHLNRRSSRLVVPKEVTIDRVHGGEIIHILYEDLLAVQATTKPRSIIYNINNEHMKITYQSFDDLP